MRTDHRRTKIVCTIGPSSNTPEMIRSLMLTGMDVARLNFSHGKHEEHRAVADEIRKAAEETGRSVGIMADLQGPKIRTGWLEDGEPIHLEDGAALTITTKDIRGRDGLISTTYQDLPNDVNTGDAVFIADGLLQLRVESVKDTEVECTVIHGGLLSEHKGINLPGVNVSAPSLTEKDIEDLEYALTMDIDYVALSFARTAEDIIELKRRITDAGRNAAVIAKIERPEGLDNFDDILDATDIVMLARGDLGVEVPLDQLPQIQKNLISKCNDVGVPVITATQMLESMTTHPRPTRAEVADVANAIYDGTDAVMLSGETASGDFPIDAVRVMSNIASNADAALSDSPPHERIVRMRESGVRQGKGNFGDAICQSACRVANAVGAKRIVCFTKTGATASLIARYRPGIPITALALDESVRYRCAIIWGVDSARTFELCATDDLDPAVDAILLANNLAEPGDIVVVAGGIPLALRTRTNMLKIHKVKRA